MLSAAEQAVNARPAPVANPWEQRLFSQSTGNDEDIDMNDDKYSKFRFLRSAYSVNEIEEFRKLCETRYGFPSHLREPTTAEKKVIKGILEGSILCAVLPDFLKRVCTNKAYRYIQNTIKAQVEGDLVLLLSPDFKNFPQFQTRKRLTAEFFFGRGNDKNDSKKVAGMLQEAKQICYDEGQHAIHIICWTRELAAKWSTDLPHCNSVTATSHCRMCTRRN